MRISMGSFHLGKKKEEERHFSFMELGDTVSIKELTHVWNEPKPKDPSAPYIAEGSCGLEAGPEKRFCMLYLGYETAGKPLTQEQLEKRMNKLGWFRRDNG